MKIIDSVNTYREMRKEFEVKKIGFVPTMGALHIGHAALIERSVAECDVTVWRSTQLPLKRIWNWQKISALRLC